MATNWNFLSNALQSGLNSAMQFGQLDLQRDQNKRAQESHELEMQTAQEEAERQERLRKVKGMTYRELMRRKNQQGQQGQPGQQPQMPRPPQLQQQQSQLQQQPKDFRVSEPTQPILPRRRPEKPGGDTVTAIADPRLSQGQKVTAMADPRLEQPVGPEGMPEMMMDPQADGSKPVGREGMPEQMMSFDDDDDDDDSIRELADPQIRAQRKTDLQTISAMLQNPEGADPQMLMQSLNNVYGGMINQGGPDGSQKRIVGMVPVPGDEDEEDPRLVPILEVTKPDGSVYRAEMTAMRSDDPNDPPLAIPASEMINNIEDQMAAVEEYDRLAALEQEAIELGDFSALDRIYEEMAQNAEEERWRGRQEFTHGLGKDMAFLENELNTNRDFQQHYMQLQRDGLNHEQALERAAIDFGYRRELQNDSQSHDLRKQEIDFGQRRVLQEDEQGHSAQMQGQRLRHDTASQLRGFDHTRNMAGLGHELELEQMDVRQRQEAELLAKRQGFESAEAQREYERQRALNEQEASLREPTVVRDADGNAIAMPTRRGQPALPVNKQIRSQTEATLLAQTESGKPAPHLETARALKNYPTEEPVRLPASSSRSSRDPNQVTRQDRAELAMKIMEQNNEGAILAEEKMTMEEALQQADQLLGQGGGLPRPQSINRVPQSADQVMRGISSYGVR